MTKLEVKEMTEQLVTSNRAILVEEYDDFDWFQLELQDPNYYDVEDGKEFLRSN